MPGPAIPYRAAAGARYDSGDFPALVDRTVAEGGLDELLARRRAARGAGSLYGVGYAAIVETSISNMGYITALLAPEVRARAGPKDGAVATATVSLDPGGAVTVNAASAPQGQGHRTVLAQVVAAVLGLAPQEVVVNLEHDTQTQAWSIASGNYSSRFAGAVAGAAHRAALRVRERLAAVAAQELNTRADGLLFAAGRVHPPGNPDNAIALARLAGIFHWSPSSLPDGMEPGLRVTEMWSPPALAPPDPDDRINGAGAYSFVFDFCGLEVDPVTCRVRIDRYVTGHDSGVRLHPAMVDGQIRGAFRARGGGGAPRGAPLRRGRNLPLRDPRGLSDPHRVRGAGPGHRPSRRAVHGDAPRSEGGGRRGVHEHPGVHRERGRGRPRNRRRAGPSPPPRAPRPARRGRPRAPRRPGGESRAGWRRRSGCMKPAPFDYLRPAAVEEAVAALGEAGDEARILAGGLSLVPMMNFRVVTPAVVVDIGGLEALRRVEDHGTEIEVGAGVAQAALERWPDLARRLPLLAEAFPHVGHYPTRARGTVGGSVAHADPSAELPLALAVLGGSVRLRSAGGERLVPARAFFEGPLETACGEDEMVAATRWPATAPGMRHAFDEVALRHGDFAIASCAVVLHEDRMAVGFGGVANTPVVREWPRLGRSALDDALAGLAKEIEVVDDGDGGGAYRRGLVRTLGRRTVERAATAAPASPDRGTTGHEPAEADGRVSWERGLPARAGSKAPQSARGQDARAPRAPAFPGGRLRAGERHLVEFVLNGERCAGEAPPRLLLSDFLRQRFGRRGVHVGCEHGVCGACTVRLDGAPRPRLPPLRGPGRRAAR